MLSPEEVLLFKAVQEEQENQRKQQAAGLMGATGGGLLGAAAGTLPHMLGRAIGRVKGSNHVLKPGLRMAGGLAGAMVGGGLGAGVAAMAKQNNAGKLLGQMQAGTMDDEDVEMLAKLLGEAYSKPSELM